MGKYIDYASMSFDGTQIRYEFTDDATQFVADEILYYATKDCYVRLISGASTQIKIPAATWFITTKGTPYIWVEQVSESGTLEVWAEGDRER